MMAQQQITLAMEENKRMASGQAIPATEMAAPAHTRVHIEFLRSEQVPPGDSEITKIFTHHIVGELLSQEQRKGAGMGMGMSMDQPGNMGTPSNSPLTAVQAGETARRAITPGKAPGPKSEMKLGEVMPGRVTGSRTAPYQA